MTDVPSLSAQYSGDRRASAWRSEFCTRRAMLVNRTDRPYGARTRSAKPVDNQRRTALERAIPYLRPRGEKVPTGHQR
jgi:hypothetical protein